MKRDSHIRSLLLVLLLGLIPGTSQADDIDAVGGLFFRVPFAADGTGPQQPRLGFGVGPSALPRAALSFEMNADGFANLGIAGFSWQWQMDAPADWGGGLSLFGFDEGTGPASPGTGEQETRGHLPKN